MDHISRLYQLFIQSSGITTDTRKIEKGNIFFALKGENFDGNEYATKALGEGASYVVIDDATKNIYMVDFKFNLCRPFFAEVICKMRKLNV